MKISPDGSLPKITSSSKGIKRHMKIIKIPESEMKEDGLLYKLVWIGTTHDTDSEKSEEEPWSDDDLSNIQFPTKTCLNNSKKDKGAKNAKSQSNYKTEIDKCDNEHSAKEYKNNKQRSPYRTNYLLSKNFKSGRRHKIYNNSPVSNMERKYKYFSNDYGSTFNFRRKYTSPPSNDVEPWQPNAFVNVVPSFQCVPLPPGILQTTLSHSTENCKPGLLGNTPFSPPRHNFPQNRQNDHFSPNSNDNFPLNRNDNFPPNRNDNFPHNRNDNFPPSRNNFPARRRNNNFAPNIQNDNFPPRGQSGDFLPRKNIFPSNRQDSFPSTRHNDNFPANRQNDNFPPSRKSFPSRGQNDSFLPNRNNDNFPVRGPNDVFSHNRQSFPVRGQNQNDFPPSRPNDNFVGRRREYCDYSPNPGRHAPLHRLRGSRDYRRTRWQNENQKEDGRSELKKHP